MDLSLYYAQICKEPILTKEQEFSLLAIFKDETKSEKDRMKAREQLLKSNLRFVFKQAKNYSRNDPSVFGDLISAGNEGLIVGLDKFNPDRETRFLSYAGWWVIQRILKEMSRMRIVSLPIWKQQLASRIAKVLDNSQSLTLEDLKLALPDIADKDLKELSKTNYLTYYIDDLDESNFEIDPIGDEVERNIDNEKIYTIVKALPEPHCNVIIMMYGMDDGEEKTSQQIRRRLLLGKEEFKQVKKEAIEMLRVRLARNVD